jgi:zinc D-Ala-D-Ala carboxypeptidase
MQQRYAHWSRVPKAAWRWPSFSPEEIACRGTGQLLVDTDAMTKLQALRDRLGKPLILRSAYRTPDHNAAVGGTDNSQHTLGRAFDVSMANHNPHAFEVAARVVGFTGFGFYPKQDFIHIDTGPVRQWGTPFPAETPVFTPEVKPTPVLATNTAKATAVVSAGGLAAVATQAAPVIEMIGRLPVEIAITLIVVAAAGVLLWRWRAGA